MVRKKEKPSQLSAAQQKKVTWNLEESRTCQSDENPGPSAHTIVDLIEDSDSEYSEEDEDDFEYVPTSYQKASKKKSKNNLVKNLKSQAKSEESVNSEDDDEYLPQSLFFKTSPTKNNYKNETPKVKRQKRKEELDYGLFNEILKKCEFSVKIDYTLSKISRPFCLMGIINLNIIDYPNDLPDLDSCWLYVSKEPGESALYFEWYESEESSPLTEGIKKINKSNTFRYCSIDGSLNFDLWCGLNIKKCFQVIFHEYESRTNTVSLHVYFLRSGFVKLNYPYEYNQGHKLLSSVCFEFFGIKPYDENDGEKKYKHDVEIFYRAIKNIHRNIKYNDYDVQHPNLIPQLRLYQRQAVQWMLYQERFQTNSLEKDLHPLYIEIKSLDDKILYYNKYGKFFVEEKPLEEISCPGGILADEMGLGKTVEVLACIMCHLKKTNNDMCLNVDTSETNSGLDSLNENSYELQDDEIKMSNCDARFTENNSINYGLTNSENVKLTDIKCESENKEIKKFDENVVYEKCNTTRSRQLRRSAVNVASYSELDPILDSFESDEDDIKNIKSTLNGDQDYMPNINSDIDSDENINVEERKEIKHKTRGSKRKLLEVNYFEDEEFKVVNKKTKSYDPEKEISESSILSTIDKVILEKGWDGMLGAYKKQGSYKEYRKFLKMKKKDPYYMMSLKERLDLDYLNKLSEYSGVSVLNKSVCQGFFDEKVQQKSYFECVCGMSGSGLDERQKVQCTVCSLWQHGSCVNFNLQDPDRGKYICPHCWTTQTPALSSATLIVSPSSICYQWVEEIKKHIKERSLKVFVYKGIANSGYIQPRRLASYDIVITTYETLRKEVNYIDLPHSNSEAGRKFRFPKRFMTTPSPLPCVEWWRICLDEAQMVEGTTSKTAAMALRLSAVNRWCITGTPIQKSINDLQGLLTFLGVDPYCVYQWWQRCLYNPYCYGDTKPLHDVMAKYMWRNSKMDVLDQLDIPLQTETIHWLNFSPVEEHFYKRLHEDCSSEALIRIRKFPNRAMKLSSLDRKSFSSLLQPLIKLRQACNHPQIVKGHFTSLHRKTLTMEQLLENLLKKTQVEAEDAQRLIVASLNGLAAIDIIREEYVEAVEKYRAVLRSVEDYKEILKTDSLQQLHTLHNLAELIQCNHAGVQPTLRDDKLNEEAKAIKEKYLKHYPQRIEEANLECTQNTSAVEDLQKKLKFKKGWWIYTLDSLDREFVAEVREALLTHYNRFEERECILFSVKYKEQLMQLIETKLKMLGNQRRSMITNVRKLLDKEAIELLNGAIDCHLRPSEVEKDLCVLCAVHELFEEYEQNLFFMKDKNHMRSTNKSKETKAMKERLQLLEATRQGNWGQGEIEKILKYIQTKSLKIDSDMHEDSQTHLGILQIMKKEFKNFRILWRAVYDHVSALDEVNMATLRFRLRYPGEEKPVPKKKKNEPSEELEKKFDAPTYILEEGEVQQQEMKLKSEKIVSENELRVKLGQYYYLQNLKKGEFGKEGDSNPEPCPVCQGKLGHRWKVLLCGHSYCMDCVSVLIKRVPSCSSNVSISCPMCRQPTKIREIAYVDMKTKEEDEIKVTGSLSTKAEGVVRVMLKIKYSDPKAKVLIFSYWSEVLEVIADGLEKNGITHRILLPQKKFQLTLEAFKENQEITTLLLPLSYGANGLNLVEATHVILVEPILNPAAEFQAIGRIHRIGQKKSTFVHRFVIHSTIEERMHTTLHPKYEESSKEENSLTIEDLYQLFITHQNDQEHSDSDLAVHTPIQE